MSLVVALVNFLAILLVFSVPLEVNAQTPAECFANPAKCLVSPNKKQAAVQGAVPPKTKPVVSAETKARQSRRQQCFANKEVNIKDQKLLKSLGFYSSEIDGIMGTGSRAAIERAEQFLGPWSDDMGECLSAGERTILEVADAQAFKGASCVFGEKTKAEVFHLYNRLRAAGLIEQSFGSFYPYQFAGFLNLMGKLENDLVVRGYYNRPSFEGKRDCWLDSEEIIQLTELLGNSSKSPTPLALASGVPEIKGATGSSEGNITTDKVIQESCEQNPTVCSVVQLCARATEVRNGQKAWLETPEAVRFVDLAKGTGLQCGVAADLAMTVNTQTCDEDPAYCSVVQLCQRAVLTDNGTRLWNSDQNSSAYVSVAKSAGLSCGVQSEDEIIEKVQSCTANPKVCSVAELCTASTFFDNSGNKVWQTAPEFAAHVSLAKEQGVSCGVFPQQLFAAAKDTCEDKPSLCSLAELCRKAISFETGSLGWATDPKQLSYVEFAKTAGISCGVPESVTTNDLIVQDAPTRREEKRKTLGPYIKRKALVIGNSEYGQQTPLKNPRSDAETIARSLEKVGFEVELAFDLSRRDLGRAITSFSSRAKEADISLFYFAGHGIEIDSRNYLIPTDAIMDDPAALKYDVIDLEEAIDAVAGSAKLSLVMVDACRDNPFNKQIAGLNRSLSRGLKVIETDAVSKNQIVSFAAESGQVAEDGTGSNSPYAQIFSELVIQPNLEIGKMFRQLSDRVAEITAGRQMPVSRNRLSGEDIFFLIER